MEEYISEEARVPRYNEPIRVEEEGVWAVVADDPSHPSNNILRTTSSNSQPPSPPPPPTDTSRGNKSYSTPFYYKNGPEYKRNYGEEYIQESSNRTDFYRGGQFTKFRYESRYKWQMNELLARISVETEIKTRLLVSDEILDVPTANYCLLHTFWFEKFWHFQQIKKMIFSTRSWKSTLPIFTRDRQNIPTWAEPSVVYFLHVEKIETCTNSVEFFETSSLYRTMLNSFFFRSWKSKNKRNLVEMDEIH